MSKTKIFSLNFYYVNEDFYSVSYFSRTSLLDADIVIVSPHHYLDEFPKGKGYSIAGEASFHAFSEAIDHWKNELNNALIGGKTVIFFLEQPQEIRESLYSSSNINTYDILPANIGKVTHSQGKRIKPINPLNSLKTYWDNFSSISDYEVYLEDSVGAPFLETYSGSKTVGTVINVQSSGNLILVPPLDIDYEDLFEDIDEDDESDEEVWSEAGKAFIYKLRNSVMEMHNSFSSDNFETLQPEWVSKELYKLTVVTKIEDKLKIVENKIDSLNTQKQELIQQLDQATEPQNLLFENGKKLENVVLIALRKMGFKAENYQDADLEFDAVFTSDEGRFIGEVEGKDNKAINVSKFSQLNRQIDEDFEREEISEHAKGVLFGNAFRLTDPQKREPFFTNKCLSSAKRSGFALVRTIDLFEPLNYLSQYRNTQYAKQCRLAIHNTSGGIVEFPTPPKKRLKKTTKKDA